MEPPSPQLAEDVRQSWHRFVDVYEPLRPDLYRYSRYLTRSAWEAEDLVQDTLARAFVTLGCSYQVPANPKAWLFRVASNLWIDRTRRAREVPGDIPDRGVEDPGGVDRDAAGTLIGRLAPQERAAVVLKDVFELTLAEIAESLSTTVGAVKAALHRGRGKLREAESEFESEAGGESRRGSPKPAPALLDAFCDAFNDRDIDRLTALLLSTASAELVGAVVEHGPEAMRDPVTGSIPGFLAPLTVDERGGVEAHHLTGYRPVPPRAEVRALRGEPIVLLWYAHDDGDAVRDVARVEAADGGISLIRHYFFVPDVIAEVCRELGVPFRTNGYRYWSPTTAGGTGSPHAAEAADTTEPMDTGGPS
jgi:RNA polymerase sigma-70 factor (ECF subfamily)